MHRDAIPIKQDGDEGRSQRLELDRVFERDPSSVDHFLHGETQERAKI
jgi:hypothetical protein